MDVSFDGFVFVRFSLPYFWFKHILFMAKHDEGWAEQKGYV